MNNRTYVVDTVLTNHITDESYPIYFDITVYDDSIISRSTIDNGPWEIKPVTRKEAARTLKSLRKFGIDRTVWSW